MLHRILLVLLVLLAAFMGVASATSASCLIGATQCTWTWCGLHWIWPIGTLFAAPIAFFVGVPVYFLMRRLWLGRWWQFLPAGALLAIPVWIGLAAPFESVRWQQSGLFDTINYIGSGALGALAFWWLMRREESGGA